MHKARITNDISYLASSVVGGGRAVNLFWLLFLLAKTQNQEKGLKD